MVQTQFHEELPSRGAGSIARFGKAREHTRVPSAGAHPGSEDRVCITVSVLEDVGEGYSEVIHASPSG